MYITNLHQTVESMGIVMSLCTVSMPHLEKLINLVYKKKLISEIYCIQRTILKQSKKRTIG